MKIQGKHIITAGIGLVTITGALAYWQYRRLMDYCIGFKTVKVNKLTGDNVDLDVYLNFRNNSDIKIDILSQEYQVFINDKKIVDAENKNLQTIAPKSLSTIGVKVKFNPSKSGQNIINTVLTLKPLVFRVEMKMKVKLWFFTVNIPYTYNATLKELMAPSPEPKNTVKCK